MNLVFVEITEADVPELTEVMVRVFDDAVKNHRFYEKCGFRKVEVKPAEGEMPGESWVYRKEIMPDKPVQE